MAPAQKLNTMTIEEQLKPIIEKAIAAAEATGEFVIEQAPILLQEFYMWHTMKHLLLVFFGLLITILPTYLMKKLSKAKESEYYTCNFWGKTIDNDLFIMYLPSIVTIIVGSVTFLISTFSLIKVLVAPRLYIIEYFLN